MKFAGDTRGVCWAASLALLILSGGCASSAENEGAALGQAAGEQAQSAGADAAIEPSSSSEAAFSSTPAASVALGASASAVVWPEGTSELIIACYARSLETCEEDERCVVSSAVAVDEQTGCLKREAVPISCGPRGIGGGGAISIVRHPSGQCFYIPGGSIVIGPDWKQHDCPQPQPCAY